MTIFQAGRVTLRVYTADGRAVRTASQLSPGDTVVTTFAEADPRSLYYLHDPEQMIAGEIRAANLDLEVAFDTVERVAVTRATLEAFSRFAWEQGITTRHMALEEIFVPEALERVKV